MIVMVRMGPAAPGFRDIPSAAADVACCGGDPQEKCRSQSSGAPVPRGGRGRAARLLRQGRQGEERQREDDEQG